MTSTIIKPLAALGILLLLALAGRWVGSLGQPHEAPLIPTLAETAPAPAPPAPVTVGPVVFNDLIAAQIKSENARRWRREILSTYEEIDYRDAVRQAAAEELADLLAAEKIRPPTPEFPRLIRDCQTRMSNADLQYQQTIIHLLLSVLEYERTQAVTAKVSLPNATGHLALTLEGLPILMLPEDVTLTRGASPGTFTLKFNDGPNATIGL